MVCDTFLDPDACVGSWYEIRAPAPAVVVHGSYSTVAGLDGAEVALIVPRVIPEPAMLASSALAAEKPAVVVGYPAVLPAALAASAFLTTVLAAACAALAFDRFCIPL